MYFLESAEAHRTRHSLDIIVYITPLVHSDGPTSLAFSLLLCLVIRIPTSIVTDARTTTDGRRTGDKRTDGTGDGWTEVHPNFERRFTPTTTYRQQATKACLTRAKRFTIEPVRYLWGYPAAFFLRKSHKRGTTDGRMDGRTGRTTGRRTDGDERDRRTKPKRQKHGTEREQIRTKTTNARTKRKPNKTRTPKKHWSPGHDLRLVREAILVETIFRVLL